MAPRQTVSTTLGARVTAARDRLNTHLTRVPVDRALDREGARPSEGSAPSGNKPVAEHPGIVGRTRPPRAHRSLGVSPRSLARTHHPTIGPDSRPRARSRASALVHPAFASSNGAGSHEQRKRPARDSRETGPSHRGTLGAPASVPPVLSALQALGILVSGTDARANGQLDRGGGHYSRVGHFSGLQCSREGVNEDSS
jgi:hypothetical protein